MAKTTAQIEEQNRKMAEWIKAKSGLSFTDWLKNSASTVQTATGAQGYGKRNLEAGKSYTLLGFTFRVQNPDTMTDRQMSAVESLLRQFGILTVIGLSIPDLTVPDFYPWIDLLFALSHHQINEAFFKNATGITLKIDVTNDFSDHNL